MKEHINLQVDWRNPLHFPHDHAERYKDRLKHLYALHPENGTEKLDIPPLPALTPQEATRATQWAIDSTRRNLHAILEQNGIHIVRKRL